MKGHARTKVLIDLIAALALPLAAACGASSLPDYDYTQEHDPREREYVLGTSDGVQIHVWDDPDLSTDTRVRPDGTVTMPLVGDLQAAGRTPSQLRGVIEDALEEYVHAEEIHVTVAVRDIRSYRFTVSGEVSEPGIHESDHYVTVAEAIAIAGGFTRFASEDDIVLQRRDRETGEAREIPIVYGAIESGERPEMNLVLKPGDSLHVP